MLGAFNLNKNIDIEFKDDCFFYKEGIKLFSKQKNIIENEVEKYFNNKGELEAKEIMEDWFPEIKANIFLSHSHIDEKNAITLAGFLNYKLGLNTFIDSTVWGYANNLLRKFDDEYCRNSSNTAYDYQKRNISTTHVHIMLSIALMNMMDKTEVVFFYNTPNSVSLSDDIDSATSSPWIFSEISMTRMLRSRSKDEQRDMLLKASISEEAIVPTVKYPLSLEHLIDIDFKKFTNWVDIAERQQAKGGEALDILYQQVGLNI